MMTQHLIFHCETIEASGLDSYIIILGELLGIIIVLHSNKRFLHMHNFENSRLLVLQSEIQILDLIEHLMEFLTSIQIDRRFKLSIKHQFL